MGALAKDSSLQSIAELMNYKRVVIPTPEWLNGGIAYSTGKFKEDSASAYRTSDYIEIDSSATHMFCSMYSASNVGACLAFYDAEKMYIKGYFEVNNCATRETAYCIEIPFNAAYVRFSIYNSMISNWFGEYYTGNVVSAIERVKYASEWHNDSLRIMNASPRSTSATYSDAIRVDNCGAVSLRIINTTDQNCKVTVLNDSAESNTDAMLDASGSAIEYDAQSSYTTIITPEDAHALNYLMWLRLSVTFTTAPTSGKVQIYAYRKS